MSELVVFACAHNTGRSEIAATLFNVAADPTRAHATAAGVQPTRHLHPAVVDAMREIGIDLTRARPQALTPAVAAGARWLITMGRGVQWPWIPGARRVEWPVDDLVDAPMQRVREIRDEIAGLVWGFVLEEGWETEPEVIKYRPSYADRY